MDDLSYIPWTFDVFFSDRFLLSTCISTLSYQSRNTFIRYLYISFPFNYSTRWRLDFVQQHERRNKQKTNTSFSLCAFLAVSPGAFSSSRPDISHYIVNSSSGSIMHSKFRNIYLTYKSIHMCVCVWCRKCWRWLGKGEKNSPCQKKNRSVTIASPSFIIYSPPPPPRDKQNKNLFVKEMV